MEHVREDGDYTGDHIQYSERGATSEALPGKRVNLSLHTVSKI